MIAVWVFHAVVPQYDGIPRWLFVLVYLPALGLEILPLILLIDVVTVMKGFYPKRTFVVQAVLLVVSWCFCLQLLRQSPPPPPKSGITVEGILLYQPANPPCMKRDASQGRFTRLRLWKVS